MSEYGWNNDDQSDESENFFHPKAGKDGVMFIIDCRSNMFEKNSDGIPYFVVSLQVLLQVMTAKIVSSENDYIGVTFCGSTESKNSNYFPEIFIYHDLDVPSAQRMKEIQTLVDNPSLFLEQIGSKDSSTPLPLQHALWTASLTFSTAKMTKNDFQRMWIFTNDDNPLINDKDNVDKFLVKYKDCLSLNQKIQLWHMNNGTNTFDCNLFYNQLVIPPMTNEDVFIDGGNGCFDDLLDTVKRKVFKKRAMASLEFEISDGISMAIELYCMFQKMRKPSPKWLDKRTNIPTVCETRWICEETGQVLFPETQIKTYQEYGGEKVWFSKDDMNDIKNFGKPNIKLLGFKPIDSLKDYYSMKSPYFIYPNDGDMKGSTKLFAALLKQMHSMKYYALVSMIPRATSSYRLCALLPQIENPDDDSPSGMHLLPLPFANDIRQLEFDKSLRGNEDQVKKAKQMIDALEFKEFDFRGIENPVLQKHYAAIKSLALDEPDIGYNEEEDDTFKPDVESLNNNKDVIVDFAESVHCTPADASYVKLTGTTTATKRSRKDADLDDDGKPKQKKVKAEINFDDLPDITKEDAHKYTIPVLKAWLKSRKLPISGKKEDLVERVINALDNPA